MLKRVKIIERARVARSFVIKRARRALSFISERFWLAYFIATIAALGAMTAYAVAAPFYLLGLAFAPARQTADIILSLSVRVLLSVQPWLNADLTLNLPRASRGKGLLLVSNHRSHLDAFLLLARIPGVRILAKNSLFRVPFLGMMMRLSRQIPVKRGRVDGFWAAIEQARSKLERGETVHVFPEMTRCHPGHAGTLEFLTAPFLAAMQSGALVVPIAFDSTDGAWPKGRHGLSFRHPVKARTLEPLDPADFASASALRNEARRRIEAAL